MKTYSLEEMHQFYEDNCIQIVNTLQDDNNSFLQKRKLIRLHNYITSNNISLFQKKKHNKKLIQSSSLKQGNHNQIESNIFEHMIQKALERKDADIKIKKPNDQSHFVDLITYFQKDENQLVNILSLFNEIYFENKTSKQTNYYLILINCSKIKMLNRMDYSHKSSLNNQQEETYLITIESDYLHMNECMNDMIEFTETMCCENVEEGIISTLSSRKIEEVRMNYDNSSEYKLNELQQKPNEIMHKHSKAKKVIFSGIAMKIKAEKYQNGLFVIHEKEINLNDYICEFIPVNNSITRSSFKFSLNEVKLILPFRFLYQYKALHLFLFNHSNSKIIQFEDKEDFTFIFNFFTDNCTKADKNYHEIKYHTNLWVDGLMTNYDYLMYLNYLSGRSFCDLSQYPIFPWTYVNFKDDSVDLNNPQNYRDLSLPIGLVNQFRFEKSKERYKENKYFFRNYISFPFVVYFYLMRTHPLFFLRHQGGTFNPPDRTFFSLENCWNATYSKFGDIKELIPEFYHSNGDFLKNIMNISFGTTQNEIEVNDVALPPWANSPIDLIRIMRSALESEVVSNSLHLWIDLVFGYKAKGSEAVNAYNLYYYLRYEECNDEIQEISEEDKQSFLDEIIECGQVPIQLFSYPHPKKRSYFPLIELTDIKIFGNSNPINLEIFKQKRIRAILEKKYEKERREKNVQTDLIRNIVKEKEGTYNQQIKELTIQANLKQIEFKAYVSSLKKMNHFYREMFGLYQDNKERLINTWIEKTNEEHEKTKKKQFDNNKGLFYYLLNLEYQQKQYNNRKREFETIEKE